MKKSGIYKITIQCGEVFKFYIGHSANLDERKKQHLRNLKAKRHDNTYMQRAFDKYGIEAFSFEVIELCEADRELLCIQEQKALDGCIAKFGPNLVLNVMRECVTSHLGVTRRPESIEKLTRAITGKKRTPEQIIEMSRRQTGFKHTAETKEKLSLVMKGLPQHPNSVLALSNAQKSEKRIEMLRSALCGKPKVHSDETKKKISETLTGVKQSADLIERRISKIRGVKQSPDAIAKRVASRLANAEKRKLENGNKPI